MTPESFILSPIGAIGISLIGGAVGYLLCWGFVTPEKRADEDFKFVCGMAAVTGVAVTGATLVIIKDILFVAGGIP